jgi:hypothetical protein
MPGCLDESVESPVRGTRALSRTTVQKNEFRGHSPLHNLETGGLGVMANGTNRNVVLLKAAQADLRTFHQRARAEYRRRKELLPQFRKLDPATADLLTTFTTDQATAKWFLTPDFNAHGKAPVELAGTPEGDDKLRQLVLAMVHGVPL